MAALNYAKDYMSALEQAFPYTLYFGALYATPNNGRFRWVNAKTIEIPSLTTTGRVDGDRDAIGVAARNFDNAWESKTLTRHRMWSTLIHPQDINQTNLAASIQNITTVYNNEQKFPEMDAYTVSKIYADWVAQGMSETELALTVSNVLTQFDADMQYMSEHRVPTTGRILYCTPAVHTLLKNAQQISRSYDVQNQNAIINRMVNSLDSVQIEEVPPELMKTAYNFTTGWQAGATAKQIQMLLIHPSAVITPVSYEFAQLDNPSALTNGKYYYFEESFEDVFILNKKKDAIRFVVAPADEAPINVGAAAYIVTAPVKAATAQTTHASGTGYTAAIAWTPEPTEGAFAAETAYKATVTLTAAEGYVFAAGFGLTDVTGIPANATAKKVTRTSATEVKIEVTYPATEE